MLLRVGFYLLYIWVKRITNKQLGERLDNVVSCDETYNRRSLANMPATGSENRLSGGSLVHGATIIVIPTADRGKILARILARPILICLIILKFDASDPILGSANHRELGCIFALITTGDNAEFITYVLTMVSMNWLRIGY